MTNTIHDFHIPVMGTAFTIDTPYKVAKFGISSVVSIGDDELCENMRKYYCEQHGISYRSIDKDDVDYRAKRITAYLDLLDDLINDQMAVMKTLDLNEDNDLSKYFELLNDAHPLAVLYQQFKQSSNQDQHAIESQLKDAMQAGAIDVNIMKS